MKFYLSDGLKVYGPFEHKEVAKFLLEGKISLMTYAKSEKDADWELVYKHPLLVGRELIPSAASNQSPVLGVPMAQAQKAVGLMPEEQKESSEIDWIGNLESFNSEARTSHSNPLIKFKTKAVSQATSIGGFHRAIETGTLDRKESKKPIVPLEEVWFVKSGETQTGPYNFLKMLDLISSGGLKEYDLVRKVGEQEWLNAKGAMEFSEDYISRVEGPVVKELLSKKYFRRNSSRYDFQHSISAYDGKNMHQLQGGDLSSQGCSFFTRPLIYQANQMLLLKFEVPELSQAHGYHAKAIVIKGEKFTMTGHQDVLVYRYSARFVQTTKDFNRWFKEMSHAAG